MRIIRGTYKGRRFEVPRTFKARPTTDFAKENIFNVMNGYIDFDGATALDLFSGTGSISLELVSRGCKQVISVEADRDHHAFIKQCVAKLGVDNCVTIRGDVFRFIKGCKQQFVFEHGKKNDFSNDPHFVEHREYGSVNFTIFSNKGKDNDK